MSKEVVKRETADSGSSTVVTGWEEQRRVKKDRLHTPALQGAAVTAGKLPLGGAAARQQGPAAYSSVNSCKETGDGGNDNNESRKPARCNPSDGESSLSFTLAWALLSGKLNGVHEHAVRTLSPDRREVKQ